MFQYSDSSKSSVLVSNLLVSFVSGSMLFSLCTSADKIYIAELGLLAGYFSRDQIIWTMRQRDISGLLWVGRSKHGLQFGGVGTVSSEINSNFNTLCLKSHSRKSQNQVLLLFLCTRLSNIMFLVVQSEMKQKEKWHVCFTNKNFPQYND